MSNKGYVFLVATMMVILLMLNNRVMAANSNDIINQNFCSPEIKVINKTCNRKVKTVYKTKIIYKTVKKIKYKLVKDSSFKNRFKAYLAHGDTDAIVNIERNSVKFKKSIFLGIGYQRDISKRYSLEVNYLFNDTVMLGLGVGF